MSAEGAERGASSLHCSVYGWMESSCTGRGSCAGAGQSLRDSWMGLHALAWMEVDVVGAWQ